MEEILSFIEGNQQILLITGATKTGKSSIAKKALGNHQNMRLLVPTNRLKFQHRDWESLEICSLYSYLYQQEKQENLDVNRKTAAIELIKLSKNEDPLDMIYLIDDASFVCDKEMISDEGLQFGSGNLFQDLFEFLSLNHTNRKLIVIGDPYLLPGVGKPEDSLLNKQKLEAKVNMQIQHIDLKKSNDSSALVKKAHELAKFIKSGTFNYLKLENGEGLMVCDTHSKSQVLARNTMEREHGRKILQDLNESVTKTNRYYHHSSDVYRVGDRLSVFNHFEITQQESMDDYMIVTNGDDLVVLDVLNVQVLNLRLHEEVASLRLQKMKIHHLRTDRKLIVYTLENFTVSEERRLDPKLFIALQVCKEEEIRNHLNSSFKLNLTPEYKTLQNDLSAMQVRLESGERVKGKVEELEVKLRKIEKKQKEEHRKQIKQKLVTG